jgi:hypothetical protein
MPPGQGAGFARAGDERNQNSATSWLITTTYLGYRSPDAVTREAKVMICPGYAEYVSGGSRIAWFMSARGPQSTRSIRLAIRSMARHRRKLNAVKPSSLDRRVAHG